MSLVIVLLSPVMLVSSDFRSFFSPPPTPPVSSVPPSASARVHHLTSVCYSTISTRQTAGRSHLMTAGGISSLGTRRNDNRSCTCLATSVNFCTIRLLSLLMQNSSLPANHQSYCSDSVKLERHIPLLEKVFGTDVMETYFLSVLIRRDVYSDLAMGESLKLFHRSSRLISPLEEEELISVHITSFSMRSVILLPSSLSRYCCSATTVIATLSYPITVSVQTTATGNPVILINIPVKFKLGSVIFTEATYNQSLPRHPAPNGSPSPLFTDLMPRVSAHKLSPRVILRRQHSFRSRQHTDGGIWGTSFVSNPKFSFVLMGSSGPIAFASTWDLVAEPIWKGMGLGFNFLVIFKVHIHPKLILDCNAYLASLLDITVLVRESTKLSGLLAFSTTSLPDGYSRLKESLVFLPLIRRVVNPEWFLTIRWFTSLLESPRLFQAAQRRATDLDSPRLPPIIDSIECLEYLSHRELCCIGINIHDVSLLFGALSYFLIVYALLASISFIIVIELLCID